MAQMKKPGMMQDMGGMGDTMGTGPGVAQRKPTPMMGPQQGPPPAPMPKPGVVPFDPMQGPGIGQMVSPMAQSGQMGQMGGNPIEQLLKALKGGGV